MRAFIALTCAFTGIFLGLILSGLIISNDPSYKKQLENYILMTLQQGLHCEGKGTLESVDLVSGIITLSDVHFSNTTQQWHWSASRVLIQYSWLDIISTHLVALSVTLYDAQVYSHANNHSIAFQEHVLSWIRMPAGAIPTRIQTVTAHNATVTLEHDDTPLTLTIISSCNLDVTTEAVHIISSYHTGTLSHDTMPLASALEGNTTITYLLSPPQQPNSTNTEKELADRQSESTCFGTCSIQGQCSLLTTLKPRFIAHTSWHDTDLTSSITSLDGTSKITIVTPDTSHQLPHQLIVAPTKNTFFDEFLVTAVLPCSYLADFYKLNDYKQYTGSVITTGRFIRQEGTYHATFTCSDSTYNTYPLPSINGTLVSTLQQAHGNWHSKNSLFESTGNWEWRRTPSRFVITGKTDKAVVLPLFTHNHEAQLYQAQGTFCYTPEDIQAEYTLTPLIDSRDTTLDSTLLAPLETNPADASVPQQPLPIFIEPIRGILRGNSTTLTLKQEWPHNRLELILKNDHEELYTNKADNSVGWYCSELTYYHYKKRKAQITGKAPYFFSGILDYTLCATLLQRYTSLQVPGQGTIILNGSLATHKNSTPQLTVSWSLEGPGIKLPHTYTLIKQAAGTLLIDPSTYTILVPEMTATLNQGTLTSNHGKLIVDPTGTVSFLECSLLCNDCFVHWKKDMAGIISGFITAHKTSYSPLTLAGHLVLDKTYITSNMFSADFENNFTGSMIRPFTIGYHDAHLALTLTTKTPLHCKTTFLDTDAQAQLSITGTLSTPHLSGTITLSNGILQFPYQPLYITQGTLYFLAHQAHDPTIELIARNRIKQYAITLLVHGSLKQPHILFESSPALTQTQIMTLLLGGTDDGSSLVALPISLTGTIEKLLFGPSKSLSQVQQKIMTLFKPFKGIRLVPRFTDESGRSGVKGALMVELNDNLRALFQNNIDLSEDTRVEVEYTLPEDIILRGVKDERGDIGAEIEKTWKF